MIRPACAEIDLGAIRRNVSRIGARLANGARVMAVVKANGYGHGDVAVAKAAIEAGATWCGVILVDEGVRLRDAGIDVPILLLHEPPPERVVEALDARLTPVVFTARGLAALGDANRPVKAHLKLDTGLNRLGLPLETIDGFVAALSKQPNVEIEAVFTHFAFADQPQNEFIDIQLARFADGCDRLKRHGIEPSFRHVANSAASITRPDAHFDMVRLGVAMYGLSPGPACDGFVELEPALSLKAQIAMVKRVRAGDAVSYGHRYRLERDANIASIPLGYADGWPRALTNNAEVLVGGKKHPAVGTVTMDSFMADIGDTEAAVGDEVVLIGAQAGERITADEIANREGTINYEVVTRISARIPRVNVG